MGWALSGCHRWRVRPQVPRQDPPALPSHSGAPPEPCQWPSACELVPTFTGNFPNTQRGHLNSGYLKIHWNLNLNQVKTSTPLQIKFQASAAQIGLVLIINPGFNFLYYMEMILNVHTMCLLGHLVVFPREAVPYHIDPTGNGVGSQEKSKQVALKGKIKFFFWKTMQDIKWCYIGWSKDLYWMYIEHNSFIMIELFITSIKNHSTAYIVEYMILINPWNSVRIFMTSSQVHEILAH